MKVYVVYEGPDMTYYGDATIHGVYTTQEAAEANGHALYPGIESLLVDVAEMELDAPLKPA